MANQFEITREIGIDAGHRVPEHASKCFNLHGHRYTIQATCIGNLIQSGEQAGMVLDFGFLKEEMMAVIDATADHAMILYDQDPFIDQLEPVCTKLVKVPFVPTAENLAAYWFKQLEERVKIRSNGNATLKKLCVYETPNCWAVYPS